MTAFDVAIVGAGLVGVAIAEALAPGLRVLLLERQPRPGLETSARSSGVIHAGLHYPPAALKTQWCREGNARLYRFCAEHGVPHRRTGKYIVACTAAELPALETLAANAVACGVAIDWLDAATLRRQEPALRAVAALAVADAGIVDAAALLQVLLARAEACGAVLALHTAVERILPQSGGYRLQGRSAGAPFSIDCRCLVNAAGLQAQAVAAGIEGLPAAAIPPLHYLRGHYFRLPGPAPFARLVYPLPEADGLGIHATLDLADQVRFGPDAEAVTTVDYRVAEARRPLFEQAIRRYWPALPAGALQPDYAGIRPRLAANGFRDFLLQDGRAYGLPGLINLFGIDSPGLTAALALAGHVKKQLLAPP